MRDCWENPFVVAKALTWGYRRLGRFYPRVFMAVELQTAYLVILGTCALFSFYCRRLRHVLPACLG